MKRFGIFGGTFNPPHIAHSIIAEDIRGQFTLDKILFLPSGVPPLKEGSEVISAQHRLNMARLAFDGEEDFKVSDIEINDSSGKSYTVDTLLKLHEIYKNDNVKFYLIIGIDNLINFPQWKDPEKLFLISEVVVVNRPFRTEQETLPEYSSCVTFAKVPMLEVSSSMIRDYVKNKKSIKFLVHPEVEKYISENKLYLI
ncbi:MAG TPA: nicotinate-nucleotide adenylyltransferase [Ignavibacteria bacterium]